MGSIGQTPGATTVVNVRTPDTLPFTTAIPDNVDPATDGQPAGENTEGGESENANTSTGGLSDGTTNSEGKQRVPPPLKKVQGISDEKWCQSVADKCDNEDLSSRTKMLLGEFLAEIQRNNGNIGTYLVSPVSGTIADGVGIARKYTNKFMKVIRHFVAKVKGFVIEKLTAGVKDLIQALLYPDEKGNALTPVTEWFNNLLKDLGCQMADLGDRLADWLTNVLMGYVNTIYRAAACQVDALVNGILSKINSLMEEILGKVLGPLQDILGAIAAPLNILGQAINFVLKLLGISCSGPNNECAKYRKVCTDGEEDEKNEKKDDFLDNLLSSIDNLFPATGADYTQYVCDEAYTGNKLSATTVGFTGGVIKPGGGGQSTKKNRIRYNVSDIIVEEGFDAEFIVTREGRTDLASSVNYKTLKKGTATPDEDFIPDEGILGFAPNETEKTISIKTIYSQQKEVDEDFYIRLTKNSPSMGSGIATNFVTNVAKCTITEKDVKKPGSPYNPIPENPFDDIDEVFPPDVIDTPPDDSGEGDSGTETTIPTYTVIANRSTCPEGDFIVYTITTTNVESGTILYYTLSGNGITSDDIIGSQMTGEIFINENSASVTVGIEEDGVVEEEEVLRFTLNGTGAFADVLILSDAADSDPEDPGEFDEGEGDQDETDPAPFVPPTVDPDKIVTDPDGGIIEIPVDDPGDPWAEPPYVFVGGEGIGAVATGLLDGDGYLTEIRIKAPGYGYKLNTTDTNGLRCIIDDFTLIRPGFGYTYSPDVYVDGELGVAEAVINEDGFVVGVRIKDRARTFSEFPEIKVIGGGGYGARVLPSLVCLDTKQLTTLGSTKIGTGQYIDCP